MRAELGQHVKRARSHIGAGHNGLVSGHWAESAGRADIKASLATFPNVLGHVATMHRWILGQCTAQLGCTNTTNNIVRRWPGSTQDSFILTHMVGNRLLWCRIGGFLVNEPLTCPKINPPDRCWECAPLNMSLGSASLLVKVSDLCCCYTTDATTSPSLPQCLNDSNNETDLI